MPFLKDLKDLPQVDPLADEPLELVEARKELQRLESLEKHLKSDHWDRDYRISRIIKGNKIFRWEVQPFDLKKLFLSREIEGWQDVLVDIIRAIHNNKKPYISKDELTRFCINELGFKSKEAVDRLIEWSINYNFLVEYHIKIKSSDDIQKIIGLDQFADVVITGLGERSKWAPMTTTNDMIQCSKDKLRLSK